MAAYSEELVTIDIPNDTTAREYFKAIRGRGEWSFDKKGVSGHCCRSGK